MERLEELVLLSSAPVVNLGASGGSGGGTSLVKDIFAGSATTEPSSLVEAGGRLFFLAPTEGSPWQQLWVSDGTDGGTVDLTPGLEASTPLALGDSVIFTAFDLSNLTFGIWSSDGTVAGTQQVAALPRSSTEAGVSADGVVYFDIFNFVSSRSELWKSDGAAGGTGLVAAIPDSARLTAAGSNVFFQGADFTTGSELWVSDGTEAGTHVVADINPGPDGSYPTNLTAVGGTLYFTAFESFGEPNRLWRSDGTAGGTVQVDSGLQPVNLANLGGRLVFTASDFDGSNAALWTTDGTSAGTTLVADLPSGFVSPMAVAGGKVYFGLEPEDFSDVQLWSSDGTESGTTPIAAVPFAERFTASGGRIYFTADGPGQGRELWTSDGTTEGTGPVADINPGSTGSNPVDLTDVGGVLYFTADDGSHGRELWQSSPSSSTEPPSSVDEGSSFVFTGSFSDEDDAPWTATVDYGDGTGTHPLALNPDRTFALDHQYADNGSYLVTVTVTDAEGLSGVGSMTVTVLNVAPEPAILGLPLSSPEGTTIALSALVTDRSPVDAAFGFFTSWSVIRDGELFAEGTGTTFSFTPNDNGTYLVTLTAEDKDGGVASTSSHVLTVTNVAPSVTLVGVPAGAEGSPVSFTAAVADPGAVDQVTGFGVTWGVTRDGLPFASGTGAGVDFTPDDDGTYIVTVTATDKDGDSSSAVAAIIVVNTSPTATIEGASATTTEGTAISLAAVVSDPSPADNAAGFGTAWSVTKDGSPFASGTGATFSFVPTDNGVYVVSLTATDRDGDSSTTSATIDVTNVAPTASISGDTSGVRGQARSFVLAAGDPSADDVAAGFSFQVNWGDGSPLQTIARGQSPAVGHAFKSTGTYTVQVKAIDKDGGVSLVTTRVVTIQAVQLQADPANPTRTALVVGGTTGDDIILFKRDESTGRIRVRLNGTSLGTFSPTGHLIAFGQAGCDTIEVADNVSRPSILHGGDGDDTLIGGGGNAILVGGSGRNRLGVDDGRNLLIGGSGADQLNGGCGDNIIISGSTAYDANDAALVAILTEWERNASLLQRVNNLKRGIAGGIKLDSTTVFNDRAYDSVCEHGGRDWLLVDSSDCVRGEDCDSITSYLNRPGWDSPWGH